MKERSVIFLVLLLNWACDLPFDPGPMPTDLIDTDYIERLNIFGVLRLDGNSGNSFVYVQRTMTTEEIYSFETDPVIRDALVTVTDISMDNDSIWTFIQSTDSLSEGFYIDSLFFPEAGHQYVLKVVVPDLPILTDTTIVPYLPLYNSLNYSASGLSLNLVGSETIEQYNIYVHFQNIIIEKIVQGQINIEIPVEISWSSGEGAPLAITISALDKNLVSYGNSSISIIPNTFHEDGSTVTGGYGCFGAASVISIPLF